MTDPLTLADALDFLADLAWAIFYGLAVGVGATLLFIIAMQRDDDD